MHDEAIVESVYGGRDGVSARIATGRAAAASEEPVVIEAASTTNESALMFQAPYYTDPERGLIEQYDNLFNVASWEPWLTYDAIRIGETLRKPTVAVHSQAAAIPEGIARFAENMGTHARVVWLEDVTQFDFYDKRAAVTQSADLVSAHFDRAFGQQQDVAAVTTAIEAVATLADLGRFDALETLYAEEVTVDYSSLTGEPAARVAASDLMRAWGALLPGFDRTRHTLSDIRVIIDGNAAVATAAFTADHYINERFWQARGNYRYELRRDGRAWRIVAHTMNLQGEGGSRDVLELAAQRAAERP